MNASVRSSLIDLAAKRALQFGDFVLKSGQRSDFYLDSKQLSLTSEGLKLIGAFIAEFAKHHGYQQFAGVSVGGDPLVAAALMTVPESLGVLVRKPKDHGISRALDGPKLKGRVLLLEDVVTTGGSSLEAIEVLEKSGLVVEDILCVVDRTGGKNVFAPKHFHRIMEIEEIKTRGYEIQKSRV